eukprot:GHVL01044892.1.p1 GENE.GHVL01044892.1~~GHVL01044892.1.p1  ORF type:complete len:230 (+),score=3.35 GHVL01044892.1:610-1299(+)
MKTLPPNYWSRTYKTHIQSVKTHFAEQLIDFINQAIPHEKCSVKERLDQIGKINKIERIENYFLWYRYRAKQEELRIKHKATKIQLTSLRMSLPVPNCCTFPEDIPDSSLNECYLFHGTQLHNLQSIISGGLDERHSRKGRYGHAIYSTNKACKAAHYSNGLLIICRVVLGDIYHITNNFVYDKRLPPYKNDYITYDSIVVSGPNTHDEFMIFDKAQLYPAYAVYYDPV